MDAAHVALISTIVAIIGVVIGVIWGKRTAVTSKECDSKHEALEKYWDEKYESLEKLIAVQLNGKFTPLEQSMLHITTEVSKLSGSVNKAWKSIDEVRVAIVSLDKE